jgi:hypothetical protein
MRTLTLRKAALVAALPVALSSLAACGDSSSQASATDSPAPSSSPTASHSPSAPTSLDSADFLATLKAANAKITTARFAMTMDLSGQSVPIKGVLDMTGGSPAMRMIMDITGMGTPTEMRLVDRTMYVQMPGGGGKFYALDLDDPNGPLGRLGGDAFSNIDPGSVTDQLSPRVFKKVLDRGTVTVGGKQLHHYTVLMDLSKAPKLKGMPAGAAVPKVATYDVWLDSEGRMARFVMLVKKSMRLTATYSGYGTAAHVVAPPASQVMAFPGTSANG